MNKRVPFLSCLTAALLGLASPSFAEGAPRPNTIGRMRVASVDGLWCGSGLLRDFSLQLAQRLDEVNGTLRRRDRERELHGRMEGNLLRTQSTKVGALVLELNGDALRIVDGEGQLALAQGMSFRRASGESCAAG